MRALEARLCVRYSQEMTSPMQKSLLGLTVLMIAGLMAFLISRKLMLETHRKDSLLLEMISNISTNLDRLDTNFNDISTQTKIARNRLKQLIMLHRENLLVCAILRERSQKRTFERKAARRKRQFTVS